MLLVRDKLLDDECVVGSAVLWERRRLKSVWKEAIDDRRRSELRCEDDWVSLGSFLRDGMALVKLSSPL